MVSTGYCDHVESWKCRTTPADNISVTRAQPMTGSDSCSQASIGIRLAQTGDDAEQLLNGADLAMYQAKRDKQPRRSAIALLPERAVTGG